MNKKKIIAVVGTLIAVCLIVAVSIPALGSRNRQNVTEPPVNDTQENATATNDSGGADPTSNTASNDVRGGGADEQAQPLEEVESRENVSDTF